MGKKIKMQVDNHLNAGARVNHDRRKMSETFKSSAKKVTVSRGSKPIGGDGTKMGAE